MMIDFVLYPSGWEGFGNQLLEAFAAGLDSSKSTSSASVIVNLLLFVGQRLASL